LRALATDPAARGLNDDAAVLEIGGETLVITHDMMLAGVHFLPEQDPADVAWKLVATNISDLAAKGAAPLGVLLGYQLGSDDVRFMVGLREALAHFGAALLGGDTVGGAGPQALGLTAIGRATHRPVPSRSGAKAGDGVWLTGAVGAAMTGLEALRAGTGDSAAYRRPQARLAEGNALAPQVTAMMDVSDGLLLDASRMAAASGVCLALDSGAVPLACPESRRAEALRWGDDYELLFTLPAGVAPAAAASCIGKVAAGPAGDLLVDGKAPELGKGLGFEHRSDLSRGLTVAQPRSGR
jgi:thiamine-monophosphate kinase